MESTMQLFIFVIFSFIDFAVGGECCKSYTSALGFSYAEQWCEKYCCGTSVLKLECCDNILLLAPRSDRESFCADWFSDSSNVWGPILIALAALGSLACCIFCCYQCCCKSNNRGAVVVAPMPQQPQVIMMSHTGPSAPQPVPQPGMQAPVYPPTVFPAEQKY